MTAKYVSFYLIAILALHVKHHSLQERDVPENVLNCRSPHQKKRKLYIFTRTVRKANLNAISDKNET